MASLSSELLNDPLGRGYAQYIPDSPGILVQMLNEPSYTVVKERFVSARGVIAAFGEAGAIILDKLENAAAFNSTVKWAMRFMASDGIDVGHQKTQAMLDALVPVVLTQQEADLLKDLANQPASRAEVLGLGWVNEEAVRAALEAA
jgi:hypothetical protein